MRIILRAVSICFILILQGCDLFDSDEAIPGFVYIHAADLRTDSLTEGAPTHSIVDVHVFYRGEYAGGYELPAHVPVYGLGAQTLSLAPGIKNNGMSANRVIYPFYASTEIEVDIIPEISVPITADSTAVFRYFKGEAGQEGPIRFHIENFEESGNVWVPADGDSVGVINTSDPDFIRSGTGGGKVELDDSRPQLKVYSSQDAWTLSDIPLSAMVYLEIDFKGDVPMEIGIRTLMPGGSSREVFALGLNATDEWVKVYVELTDEVRAARNAVDFQIYLEAEKPASLTEATIALDNIKLLYPK